MGAAFWLGLFGCLAIVGTSVIVALYKITKLTLEKAETIAEIFDVEEKEEND